MSKVGSLPKDSNSCLTMHQPWASLLVHGIKRIEGRSWPAPITGRLWIHAASKVPDPDTIKAMEEFYKEIYALDGILNIEFPKHYPVSRLLGCVDVVGCVKARELQDWDDLPQGVKLEGQTDFCWLCEHPQKLLVPFEMRGYQGVYRLEKKIFMAASAGLVPASPPIPIRFPSPETAQAKQYPEKKRTPKVQNSTHLNDVIAGARAATSQFRNKPLGK